MTRWYFVLTCMLLRLTGAVAQDTVADNMLLFQRSDGGWQKHLNGKPVEYNKAYSLAEQALILHEASNQDATIDNGATTKEIRYLLKTYKTTGNKE